MSKPLLIELGTEELPPKALQKLRDAFVDGVCAGLTEAGIAFDGITKYASPRRLGMSFDMVAEMSPAEVIERRGPLKAAAFEADGSPKPAAVGFAKSCGVSVEDLTTLDTPKGEYLFFKGESAPQALSAVLPNIIQNALKRLPVPKMMRWGDHDYSFVRPVHWLVVLFGNHVVPVECYGVKSGNQSYGHRFHHPQAIAIESVSDYEAQLEKAFVIASFESRRQKIKHLIEEAVSAPTLNVVWDDALLDEVSAIIEWPVPLVCEFDKAFLTVPKEALISSMQEHQKCFALENAQGDLVNQFVTVSNIQSQAIDAVIKGNQKVMGARLSDAAFFFEQDLKTPLDEHLLKLEKVTFQAKLGSMADKTHRVVALAGQFANVLGADAAQTERAALLAKTDLLSQMVFEFPELQGIMGQHYARHQGESASVSTAIFEQYLPRFSGDDLPQDPVGICVALADKLDTLVGIFSIGLKPTGSKDPFALRRAVIGILRILVAHHVAIDLNSFVAFAQAQLKSEGVQKDADQAILAFAKERARIWFRDENGVDLTVVDAVMSCVQGFNIVDIAKRVDAVSAFAAQTEAKSLAESFKRIGNMLKKAPADLPAVDAALFQSAQEKALFDATSEKQAQVKPLLENGDYVSALAALSRLKPAVDAFFEHVMVMDKDPAIQLNRLSILSALHRLFKAIADLSVL